MSSSGEFIPKQKVVINSLKGHLGHSLGACGATELALTLRASKQGLVLSTANLDSPLSYEEEVLPRLRQFDEHSASKCLHLLKNNCVLPLAAQRSVPWPADCPYFFKNSFGFGGTNVSLLLRLL
ncbi:hypothetical protein Ciccas_005971 [Cichlidogyrus casuarinus]|uniref:beta-ketoacyl-[acyl-carrier-protein] synthase I n=1 Tax=Cichlidogyrus casuarinus TaxID=1844966 RepID=A0ABD2Q747_9PLAT